MADDNALFPGSTEPQADPGYGTPEKALTVLDAMLSADSQSRIISDGQDLLSYSQDVPFRLTEYLEDAKPVVEENHLYIRIASNDFFSVSRDVVSKMISGQYDASQAYQSFNAQLLSAESADEKVVLNPQESYSNRFHTQGGNAAYSVMANTLRGIYGSDVLIATGNSFTGNVLKAGYTEKMAVSMIMPNSLCAYSRTMSGTELIETVRNFVAAIRGALFPLTAALCRCSAAFPWTSRKRTAAIPCAESHGMGKRFRRRMPSRSPALQFQSTWTLIRQMPALHLSRTMPL